MSLLTSVNPWDGGSRWLNQDWCCWWMFSSDSANLQFWITHNKILETLITLNCLHNHIRTNGPITLGSGTLNTALKMPWKHICTKIKLVLTSRFSFWKIEIILTFCVPKKHQKTSHSSARQAGYSVRKQCFCWWLFSSNASWCDQPFKLHLHVTSTEYPCPSTLGHEIINHCSSVHEYPVGYNRKHKTVLCCQCQCS